MLRTVFIEGCATIELSEINNNRRSASSNRMFLFLGDALSKTYAKIGVIAVFVIHLSVAIYCIKDLTVAFDYTQAFPSNSYAKPFIDNQYKYFTEYPFRINVVINKTLDYSDPTVRGNVENILHSIETAPYMAGSAYTESWLREYLKFIDDSPISWFSLSNYNMSNSEDFMEGLRDIFLQLKGAEQFKNDIRFSEDGKEIVASRFLVQCVNISDAVIEKKLIDTLWVVADSSIYPIYIHNFYFFLYDLSSGVEKTTLQCLFTSSVLVIIISLLFFPNFTCAICMASTIIFIELELVGYMALWGIQLNLISMICLVLSVGLCVDYAAHITCAFVSLKETDPNTKLRLSLSKVGYPIAQGCVSSILGVVVLSFAPIISVITFFKIVFLLMIFSLFHGIFLIPVSLCLWEETYKRLRKLWDVSTDEETTDSAYTKNGYHRGNGTVI